MNWLKSTSRRLATGLSLIPRPELIVRRVSPEAETLLGIIRTARNLTGEARAANRPVLRALVSRVTVYPHRFEIAVSVRELLKRLGVDGKAPDADLVLSSGVKLMRTGRAMKLVHENGRAARNQADPNLARLLIRARSWWERLAEGKTDIATIAREEEINDSYVSRIVRLNFLAPDIVAAILAGSQPATLTGDKLRLLTLPIQWEQQKEVLGF